jgi:hypothetical protein
VRRTAAIDDATRWAEGAADEGFDAIVAVGGDGTVTAVATGVLRSGRDLPIGIVARGTGNGVAQALRLPTEPEEAVRALKAGHPVAFDAIEILSHDRWSLLFLGAGLDAEINRDADAGKKRRFGYLAYLGAALRNLAGRRNRRVTLTIDGEPATSMTTGIGIIGCGTISSAYLRTLTRRPTCASSRWPTSTPRAPARRPTPSASRRARSGRAARPRRRRPRRRPDGPGGPLRGQPTRAGGRQGRLLGEAARGHRRRGARPGRARRARRTSARRRARHLPRRRLQTAARRSTRRDRPPVRRRRPHGVERARALAPRPRFFYQPGAGPLLDMGPYYVTAMVSLFGPVASVSADGGRTWPERTIGSGPRAGARFPVAVDTHVTLLLRFASGVRRRC